ncbi:MAG: glycosyltransferase family 9 protein, partial [Calditrichaeota bacterium]
MHRILLIRTDRIGDVVLTTPAATALKERYPEAHIAFLSRAYTAPLLRYHRDIDRVLIYDPEGRHRGMGGIRRLAGELRSQNFDAAVLFYPRPALAAALWLAGIPLRIGMGYRWYAFLLNRRIYEHRKHGQKHELEYNLSLLSPLLPRLPREVRFAFRLPDGFRERRSAILASAGTPQPYVIVHPGNGGSAPNLSVEQYRLLCRFLLDHTPYTVLLTGAAGEAQLVGDIAGEFSTSRLMNLAGKLDMEDLLAVIAGAKLFISSSTGPLHIAGALGIPVIGFYCPATPCSPRRWGPYHQPEWVLTPEVHPCKRCRIERCPNGNCLEKIPGDTLQRFVQRRLEGLGG